MTASLSDAKIKLLTQLGADFQKGLTTDEASALREKDGIFNLVRPPVDCPGWLCILLPCIKHIPSMKAFQQVIPDDAEVLRNGKWIRYDATSLVKGDIVRVEEGDIVPADCIVLQVEASSGDLLVDCRAITGETKPRVSTVGQSQPTQIFYGSHVAQGMAIAVVTAIGQETFLASCIRDGRFPPKGNLMSGGTDIEADEDGISLIARKQSGPIV